MTSMLRRIWLSDGEYVSALSSKLRRSKPKMCSERYVTTIKGTDKTVWNHTSRHTISFPESTDPTATSNGSLRFFLASPYDERIPAIHYFNMAQYPLPPISTLSAALADQPVPIAPELMGSEGLPPDRRTSYKQPPSPTSYPGYHPSSARDESAPWSYPPPSRSLHPWEDDCRDHPQSQPYPQPESDLNLPPSPKAKTQPRKRARPKVEPTSPDQEEQLGAREHEHEHPSGDPKMGPIFVHPPKGAAQACERCHRIKRKCDNARPRCAGCSKADVACVFELSAATST